MRFASHTTVRTGRVYSGSLTGFASKNHQTVTFGKTPRKHGKKNSIGKKNLDQIWEILLLTFSFWPTMFVPSNPDLRSIKIFINLNFMLMQENRVSIKITAAEVQRVTDALKVISDTLAPYLIALTPAQRQALPKMNDGTLPFVRKALEYASTNTQFVPTFIDVPELKIDVDATAALLQMERPMEQLNKSLSHTVMLCGSEAYIAALAFYNSVKQAAKMKVPGAEPIANDLGERFAKASAKVTRTQKQ
jgi:hypothetical protein